MADWNVETDIQNDRMYITLAGHLDEDGAEEAADAVAAAAEEFTGDFAVINDLSEFKPGDQAVMKHIQRAKQAASAAGMSASVRVTPESTTGQMQFERAGEGAEDYAVAMADSVAKAEKLLDKRREEAQ
jgi:hypothetical protein